MRIAIARAVRQLDAIVGRALGRRRVVVDARTPMNVAILAPIAAALRRDDRVDVVFTAQRPADIAAAIADSDMRFDLRSRAAIRWMSWDQSARAGTISPGDAPCRR